MNIEKETIRQALEIADEGSASLIECCGIPVCDSIGRLLWYEVDFSDKWEGYAVCRAVFYLKRRNKLRVNPHNSNQVKVRP